MNHQMDFETMQRIQERLQAGLVVLLVPLLTIVGTIFNHFASGGALVAPAVAALIFVAYAMWACGGVSGYRAQVRLAFGV